jgi:phage repressor protein C with HTH and peptisase S24 domain
MKVTENTLNKRLDALELPDTSASVIDRIRYLITLMRKTQAQFGELIDIDPSNMSKLMSGRIRVTDRMINRIVVNLGVSKEWLTQGTDVPFPRVSSHDVPTLNGSGARISDYPANGAPIYDIDVAAGKQELSRMFTIDRVVGYMNLPTIESQYPIVHVSGDSMSPKICNGSYIQIRPISEDSPIFWGCIYVVVLEDYRLVKIVRRHADRNKVILHSLNPQYDDMEIDRVDILKLYLVVAVINHEILA